MHVALSFCPNDTFTFYDWITHEQHFPITPIYADLTDLNSWALQQRFPLTKLSFAAFEKVQDAYFLLPVGAALGFGCGPKIIAKPSTSFKKFTTLAVPGELTTANLLVDRLFPTPAKKVYCRYHEVCDLILSGECDAGVIIHETRFTLENYGLVEWVDLGELWEERTHLPLPLGALAVRRDVPNPHQILHRLRASIRYATEHPDETVPFMLKHSIEKEEFVVRNHVETYVNTESLQLSEDGVQAIEFLLGSTRDNWLWDEADSVCYSH